jgi:putative hydrolase of the HAD superfamily
MISAVLFDLDETLLDRTRSLRAFLADQYRRYAGRLGAVSGEIWCGRFIELDARGLVHKSIVYPAILKEFAGDRSAADALLADYREQCCRHARAIPGMLDVLRELRSRGISLALVTNGETEFQQRHIHALGLDHLIDAVLISEAEGLRKPSRALFHRAAERLGVLPAHCLFVGDNPTVDVLGAHAAGMQTAWFGVASDWPADLPPLPGVVITTLADLLRITERPS